MFYNIPNYFSFKLAFNDTLLSSINPVEMAKKFGSKFTDPFYRKLAIDNAENYNRERKMLPFMFRELIFKNIRTCIEGKSNPMKINAACLKMIHFSDPKDEK